MRRKVHENQNEVWSDFCLKHPDFKQAYDCLDNVPPDHFSSLANHYSDLVSQLHVQVRIMGNFCLNGGIPRLTNTEGATCFVSKQGVETVNHFLLECPGFKENLDSRWDKLKTKARHLNPIDGDQAVDFITNLDQHNKMLLLLGELQLPFDDLTANSTKRFIAAAVGKIYKIHMEKLHELGAPIDTRYSLPNHKISDELKCCCSFWMYPPLWASLLVTMHDDIENRSITISLTKM